MKRYYWMVLLSLTAAFGSVSAVSCGDKSDGLKPEINTQVADTSSIAKKAGGKYDSLSDADKKKFLDLAHGSEPQAKALVAQMAMDPRQMNAGKGGASPTQ